MNTESNAYQAIIAGGGSVGLFLGICLHEAGIRCLVLEEKSKPVQHSRSLGIHPVSLELFDRLGFVEAFLNEGVKINRGLAYSERGKIGSVSFKNSRGDYSFILSIPQFKTEQILERELNRRDPEILLRDATVSRIEETSERTRVTFSRDGVERTVESDFTVGCDGKNSVVREEVGISFNGGPYDDVYVMADYTDNTIFGSDAVVFLPKDGLIESFPLPDDMRRWVVKTDSYHSDVSRTTVEKLVAERIGHDLGEEENRMLSSFGVQKFLAGTMAKGRIALAGDAAHIVSPIGGQGMNLGWLDAWDLSDVLKRVNHEKEDHAGLLASYSRRRTSAAKKAIRRAEFNMKLGRKSRFPRLKHAAVWFMLHTPVQHYMANFFTMRGLGSGPL